MTHQPKNSSGRGSTDSIVTRGNLRRGGGVCVCVSVPPLVSEKSVFRVKFSRLFPGPRAWGDRPVSRCSRSMCDVFGWCLVGALSRLLSGCVSAADEIAARSGGVFGPSRDQDLWLVKGSFKKRKTRGREEKSSRLSEGADPRPGAWGIGGGGREEVAGCGVF